MTEDDIFDVLHRVITVVTGLSGDKVILANQNESAPTGAYAAITPMVNISERGQATIGRHTSLVDRSVSVDVKSHLVIESSINFYRGNALSTAQKLKQANKRPDISRFLFESKVGWLRTSNVNNLTSLQSNRQEQRSQISIFLMHSSSDITSINNIESVSYEVTNEKKIVVDQGELFIN